MRNRQILAVLLAALFVLSFSAMALAGANCDSNKKSADAATASAAGCSKSADAATASAAGCNKSADAAVASKGACSSKSADAAVASAAGCNKSADAAVASAAGCNKSADAAVASAAGCNKSADAAVASKGACSATASAGCMKSADHAIAMETVRMPSGALAIFYRGQNEATVASLQAGAHEKGANFGCMLAESVASNQNCRVEVANVEGGIMLLVTSEKAETIDEIEAQYAAAVVAHASQDEVEGE